MKKSVIAVLLGCILCSCERVFPNDDIDFQWRLDGVERLGELHQDGNCWMSLARHIAVFEGDTPAGYAQAFALFNDSSDSLFFDFSMCADTALTMEVIGKFGIENLKFGCSYNLPKRNKLVLSGNGAVLYFTRW